MSGGRLLALVLVAGLVFGAAVAVVKGQETGARDALGNMSAPWVVVPFLAGTRYPRAWQAMLVGIAATLAAFFGFYLAEAAILDLGSHPWYTDIRLTLRSGTIYEVWGVPTGALYGVLGWLWASRRLVLAPVAVGLAFACEPLIVLTLARAGVWGGGGLLDRPWLWLPEVLIGLGCIAFAVTKAQAPPTRTS